MPNTKAQIQALIDNIDTTGNSGTTGQELVDILEVLKTNALEYAEVSVSAAEIATSGNVGISLLPNSGAGKYYEVEKVLVETIQVTTPWTINEVNNPVMYFDGSVLPPVDISVITTAGSGQVAVNHNGAYVNKAGLTALVVAGNISDGGALKMYTWNNDNPTGGDNMLLVKIWYNLRTLGTEL